MEQRIPLSVVVVDDVVGPQQHVGLRRGDVHDELLPLAHLVCGFDRRAVDADVSRPSKSRPVSSRAP